MAIANPSVAAEKTVTVSGDSVPSDCAAAKSPSGASELTGSLEGCLAIFIQHSNCRAMNGFDLYVELGREEFEGTLDGAAITFDTMYTFNAAWPSGSCPSPAPEKEIAGGCTHYVSGDGIQGVIRFYDVIPTVGEGASNFLYEGVLSVSDAPAASIAPVVPELDQVAQADIASPQGERVLYC
ncbi:MAG: hypothetical protein EOP20_10725 [Hyphomicrobiales bacterium]|nr:MAG: hypothetical protein EOP20_10725 [Hyphomicrobiales bacterium]